MALERFVAAQDGCWAAVLAELRAGRKATHWMWFVFPQLRGLGRSATARHYGLEGAAEARAYLAHPVLGARLHAALAAAEASGETDPVALFGPVDALKLRSCLTLFEAVAADPAPFAAALERFCDGQRDARTLALLGQ